MTPLPAIRNGVLDLYPQGLAIAGRRQLCGALLWAAAMGASALVNLLLDDWETPAKIRFVSSLFAAGGALAFPLACSWRGFVSLGRHWQAAFAAALVCLLAATIGFDRRALRAAIPLLLCPVA